MNDLLVSVIIPTYNRAYCLSRSVDSALRQTWRNLEVILVDDGSTDGTRELVDRLYSREPRVRYIRRPNGGVSAARNTGLNAAQGAYIALLDSDDVWKEWKTELQVRSLEAAPGIGMVWTDMEAVNPAGEILDAKYLKRFYTAYGDIDQEMLFRRTVPVAGIWPEAPAACAGVDLATGDIFSEMILGNLVHTSTVMLTRERFERVREFREDLRCSGEDYDFHLRTCREGPVGFLNVSSIQYQVGGADQLTRPALSHWVARNFLNTILPVIERDRARIHLSDERLERLLAESHAWLGEALLNAGEPGAARHLRRALRVRRDPRTALLWLAAHVPPGWLPALRRYYRMARGGTRAAAAPPAGRAA